jgi:hypothetical protein
MTTPWNLFLDDTRTIRVVYEPEDQACRQGPWVLCNNSEEALAEIEKRGVPTFMSLDYDLGIVNGKKQTALVFANAFADKYADAKFEYFIHSTHPDARYLRTFFQHFFLSQDSF